MARALVHCMWTLLYFGNVQSKDEHELVWNCCNPFVAALLAAAQEAHQTPAERMLGVWDTQFYGSCGAEQPDQSICAIACRPSEHIAVGYNEVVYASLDRKHIGKMGQYLKTALEANQQLTEACGLLMCKSAVQVHRVVRMGSNGPEWPFKWECSPQLVFQDEDGGVPLLTRLWLADWADRVVKQSNDVPTSFEITTEDGKSATATFGAHLGEGASSRVFSCELSTELGKEPIVLKVLRPGHVTEAPLELQLLRHFSDCNWCPTLKGVSRHQGKVVAIAMEHAGSSLPRGSLTQSMFETLVCALKIIHSARPTVAGLGTPGEGCWVHCDVRPANVTTKHAELFLLDLGACTWSTTERGGYVGTVHCASDEILDYLADCNNGHARPCPRSAASDLVSAVRTAMLLSLGVTVQNGVYDVPSENPERMKLVWQEVTPPAWQTAVQRAERGDYDGVITAVKALLPCKIPRRDAKVGAAATADAIPAGAVASAGAGGHTKQSTKNKCKQLFVHFLFFLLFFFVFLLFSLKQYRHRPAEDQIPWVVA